MTNLITYGCIVYTLFWTRIELKTVVMIGANDMCKSKSTYHSITTTMIPHKLKVIISFRYLHDIHHNKESITEPLTWLYLFLPRTYFSRINNRTTNTTLTSFYLTHISVESGTDPLTWLYLFLPHTYFSIIVGGYSNK